MIDDPQTPALARQPGGHVVFLRRIDAPGNQGALDLSGEWNALRGATIEPLENPLSRVLYVIESRKISDDLVRPQSAREIPADFERQGTAGVDIRDERIKGFAQEQRVRTQIELIGLRATF